MFGRSNRKSRAVSQDMQAPKDARELDRLRDRVKRLERVLEEIIVASDEVMLDLREREATLAAPNGELRSAFADEWQGAQDSTSAGDEFFSLSEIDERARKWLLAIK